MTDFGKLDGQELINRAGHEPQEYMKWSRRNVPEYRTFSHTHLSLPESVLATRGICVVCRGTGYFVFPGSQGLPEFRIGCPARQEQGRTQCHGRGYTDPERTKG